MLQGPRVTLRAITPADYPRLLEFVQEVEFELQSSARPPAPITLAAFTEFFDGVIRDEDRIRFAIQADGIVIGDCGLKHLNRIDGTAELGIGIGDRAYHGRGFGRETMTLLVDYAFRLANFRRIWLEVLADNERAIRCYGAVGFVVEGRQREHAWSDGRYVDVVQMGLLRSEWNAPAKPIG
jgi:RimJ/RimL family protein N-acetyltransferase